MESNKFHRLDLCHINLARPVGEGDLDFGRNPLGLPRPLLEAYATNTSQRTTLKLTVHEDVAKTMRPSNAHAERKRAVQSPGVERRLSKQ